MVALHDVNLILKEYFTRHRNEVTTAWRFISFVGSACDESLTNRKNPVGHITASGLIVSRASGKVLLLNHLSLGKWLSPGGHIDPSDSSVAVGAVREIGEETGIMPTMLTPLIVFEGGVFPVDIDSHAIAANPRKGEGEHYHHDFRFAFWYDGGESVTIDVRESLDYQWVTLEELAKVGTFGVIAEKLQSLIGER